MPAACLVLRDDLMAEPSSQVRATALLCNRTHANQESDRAGDWSSFLSMTCADVPMGQWLQCCRS